MLTQEYCRFINRLVVFLDGEEVARVYCNSREQADEIFVAMQKLLAAYRGSR